MSLYLKYRPNSFDEVYGNENICEAIQSIIKKERKPHTYLFHGPTGCGKTTLGRILADKLGCKGNDLREIDSADFRGIDTVREIRKQAQFKPLESPCRVWLIDECFAKGTKIKSPNGEKNIENFSIGDSVYSLAGVSQIKNIFKNKVDLNQVVKLSFSNGKTLYTTKQHLFLTKCGWKESQYLNKKDFIFSFNSYIMDSINLTKGVENEKMQMVQERVSRKKINTSMLQQILFSKIKKQKIGTWKKRKTLLSKLQYFFYLSRISIKEILRANLCWNMEKCSAGNQKENVYKRICYKDFQKTNSFYKNTSRISESCIRQNEKKQSNAYSQNDRKNETSEKDQWNITYLVRNTWWKWTINQITNTIIGSIRMAHRICCFIRKTTKRISNLLQNRCGLSQFIFRNRDRRERAFIEKKYIERYEKRKTIKKIRVENIAIYKRGSNNESFSNIITDKERDQDYITFYDLEIDKHPSYFANEIAVHNCHKLTNDAQNALLKALEDTPSHVYFILCTTDPQKLIVTIKGRCSQFQVHPLSDRQMFKLLRHVVKAEEDTLHKEVYDQIIQDSLGHPRNALQILEQVLNVESEKRLMTAKRSAEIQSQSIELCRALIDTSGWKKVANILEGLKNEDSENIRRAILGYCQAILLKGINNQAGLVMEYMIEPFYNTGYPGLVFACYSIKCGD